MSRPDSKTQGARILRLLIDAHGQWVPLPEIMACAAQYNARVFELRRLGFVVENKTETDPETGARHSWFRLVSSPPDKAPEPPKPDLPRRQIHPSDYMRKVREEQAAAAPLFAGVGSR